MTGLGALAALGYGVSDFLSGMAARRMPAVITLARNEIAGLALLLVAWTITGAHMSVAAMVWAAAAGVVATGAMWLLFWLMATAPLSLVCPITAVLSAGEPVMVALFSGDRLGSWAVVGVAAGVLAVALLGLSPESGGVRGSARVIGLAALVGAGLGLYFVLMAKAGAHGQAGIGPVMVAKFSSLTLLVPLVVKRHGSRPLWAGSWRVTGPAGFADAVGDLCFSLAVGAGSLAVGSVMAALAPAITVVLALIVLREKVGWRSGCGLGLAGVALSLLAT